MAASCLAILVAAQWQEAGRRARAAEEARRALQRFLDLVSHDLRTPLASIRTAAGSLLQCGVGWTDEDRLGFAALIDEEADRVSRLVERLLDLRRIEAGVLQPERD